MAERVIHRHQRGRRGRVAEWPSHHEVDLGMNDHIRRTLESDRTLDITTTGRISGLPHRIEIWFHNADGAIYITGTLPTRDWYAPSRRQTVFHLPSRGQHPGRSSGSGRAGHRSGGAAAVAGNHHRSDGCESGGRQVGGAESTGARGVAARSVTMTGERIHQT